MDADTEELRTRAAQLAKREAERVELLERAETAWIDLELGYQRRLRLAEEKEEDMANQVLISHFTLLNNILILKWFFVY